MLDKYTHTHTHIPNKPDRHSKTGHRFGAHYEYQDSQVFNSQAVSACCQHTQTRRHKYTHVHQRLTNPTPFESGTTHYTAALILKQILILDTFYHQSISLSLSGQLHFQQPCAAETPCVLSSNKLLDFCHLPLYLDTDIYIYRQCSNFLVSFSDKLSVKCD